MIKQKSRAEINRKTKRKTTQKQKSISNLKKQEIVELPPNEIDDAITFEDEIFEDTGEIDATAAETDVVDFDDDEIFDFEQIDNFFYSSYDKNKVFMDNPVLYLASKYRIKVVAKSAGNFFCSFEKPDFFYSRYVRQDYLMYVNRLNSAMDGIVDFLNMRRAFLEEPDPMNLFSAAAYDLQWSEYPIIVQKGFVKTLETTIEEQDFSRLLPKIYLIWPDKAMPLSVLFSKEFKLAWVKAMLNRYNLDLTSINVVDYNARKTKNDIKNKSFQNISRRKKIEWIFYASQLDINTIRENIWVNSNERNK